MLHIRLCVSDINLPVEPSYFPLVLLSINNVGKCLKPKLLFVVTSVLYVRCRFTYDEGPPALLLHIDSNRCKLHVK
jgi:hypothetical protein